MDAETQVLDPKTCASTLFEFARYGGDTRFGCVVVPVLVLLLLVRSSLWICSLSLSLSLIPAFSVSLSPLEWCVEQTELH